MACIHLLRTLFSLLTGFARTPSVLSPKQKRVRLSCKYMYVHQSVVDVLILYTKKAMLDANNESGAERSSAQMETEIATAYQEANDALTDSGVGFNIRIVHMEQVLLLYCCVPVLYRCGELLSALSATSSGSCDVIMLATYSPPNLSSKTLVLCCTLDRHQQQKNRYRTKKPQALPTLCTTSKKTRTSPSMCTRCAINTALISCSWSASTSTHAASGTFF